MRKWTVRLFGLLLACPLAAPANVDLAALDADMAGPRSEVLVLGTVHLSGMPEAFDPASLDGLLERLAAFRPDIITIEALPGEECDLAARHPAKYGARYCAGTDVAQAATGLSIPEALAEVDRVLADWPAQPSPARRRHLAALFLAANDRASAYVQWLQLPPAARHADDRLGAELVELLEQVATRNNENYQVAARLAARLGLQRVHAVDNHTGDRVAVADMRAFGQAVEEAWKADRRELDARIAQEQVLSREADLLPLYCYINDPQHLRVLADSNVRAALRSGSPGHYPQMWVAGWEIRNLRMVANVRETFRERPGARVLSIVGASHKPWLDDWLGQLQGVDIVDARQALGCRATRPA